MVWVEALLVMMLYCICSQEMRSAIDDAATVDATATEVLNIEQDSMYQDDVCVHWSRDTVV